MFLHESYSLFDKSILQVNLIGWRDENKWRFNIFISQIKQGKLAYSFFAFIENPFYLVRFISFDQLVTYLQAGATINGDYNFLNGVGVDREK
jgi:hypothetical protein